MEERQDYIVSFIEKTLSMEGHTGVLLKNRVSVIFYQLWGRIFLKTVQRIHVNKWHTDETQKALMHKNIRIYCI